MCVLPSFEHLWALHYFERNWCKVEKLVEVRTFTVPGTAVSMRRNNPLAYCKHVRYRIFCGPELRMQKPDQKSVPGICGYDYEIRSVCGSNLESTKKYRWRYRHIKLEIRIHCIRSDPDIFFPTSVGPGSWGLEYLFKIFNSSSIFVLL